ncbi:hypothetical protein E4U52_000324 [Claviceps spartinae]|nr:hypothetical protein E4U52_000324 [Claviceps spartinae]
MSGSKDYQAEEHSRDGRRNKTYPVSYGRRVNPTFFARLQSKRPKSSGKGASYRQREGRAKKRYNKKRYNKKRYNKKRYNKKRHNKKRHNKKRHNKKRYNKKRYNNKRQPMASGSGDYVLVSTKNINLRCPSKKLAAKYSGPFPDHGASGST